MTGLVLIAALGAAQRLGWIQSGSGGESHGGQQAASKSDVVYFCPMMCTPLRQSTPGRCPVCAMDLVPMKSGGGQGPQLSVEIDSAARRLANIQTVPVKYQRVRRTVRSIGRLAFDESRQKTISAYVDGRIEKLHVDFTGTEVRQGDHMALVYSPDLYAAQVEYLVTRKANETQPASSSLLGETPLNLRESARQKLIELGMTPQQIRQLQNRSRAATRMQICAPMSGTVIEKLKREGDYVKTGEPIFRIADLSSVWLMLDLFPEDAARVRYGQKVEAEMQSLPGEVFVGRVAFVDPFVSEKTRTVRVRVEILNPDRRLRPGDYATAKVTLPILRSGEVYDPALAGKWISPRHPQVVCSEPGTCPLSGKELVPTRQFGYAETAPQNDKVLVVPRNAVLMAGDHSIVYIETDPGKFEIRRVRLGPLSEKEAVVYQGVKDGEKVVTSGNFLIDSQMQLAGNPSIIDPTAVLQIPSSPDKPSSWEKKPGPLELQLADLRRFSGGVGIELDELYTAYFAIQKSLAGDKKPAARQVRRLQSAAKRLAGMTSLPKAAGPHVESVAKSGLKLTEGDIKAIRKHFKPVSHAVLQLSALARGPKTGGTFTHFFCPMVPGGGGDWLQADASLLNPYFGSQMLKCGKRVRTLGIQRTIARPPGPQMPVTERR
ncbi:MAG: efflux RND transporter periplasmic adaptor subunit [Planctomycetaceae bacterium]